MRVTDYGCHTLCHRGQSMPLVMTLFKYTSSKSDANLFQITQLKRC